MIENRPDGASIPGTEAGARSLKFIRAEVERWTPVVTSVKVQ